MKNPEESNLYSLLIKVVLIALGIIAGIIFLICVINSFKKFYSKRHTTTSFDSFLEKVLNINELHSYEYTYKSWATVYETKYDMETYSLYNNISSILTDDKKKIKEIGVNLEQSFQDYKLQLKKENDNFQTLLINGAAFEDLTNAGFKNAELFAIAQKTISSKEPIDIYKYYYYTLLPKRLSVLTLCESYDDLCDLEHFLRLKESKARESIKKVKYIVAYKGTVRAGIDEPIEIKKSKDGTISIYLPPTKILSVAVEFLSPETDKDGYEIKSVIENVKNVTDSGAFTKEARLQCRNDLYAKINMEQQFLELAEENLKETIKALITPFIPENTNIDFKKLYTEED